MSKKFSQFDTAASIAGDESFVGLKDGDNSQFPFADVLSYIESQIADDFWPLSGSAALTDDLQIDGDGFDITLGAPDSFGSFSVYASSDIYLDVSSGADGSYIDFNTDSILFNAASSADASYLDVNSDYIELNSTDGVDTSSLTLTPDSFYGSVGDPDFGPGAKIEYNLGFIDIFILDGIGGQAGVVLTDDGDITLLASNEVYINSPSLILRSDLFQSGVSVPTHHMVITDHAANEWHIPCAQNVANEINLTQLQWYNNVIDNSLGVTPLNTNSDLNIFGSIQDVTATILFKISAIASDGSEGAGGTMLMTIRRDGSSNPVVVVAATPTFAGDNVEADVTATVNGTDVRLTITTPTAEIYRWGVFAEINMIQYT